MHRIYKSVTPGEHRGSTLVAKLGRANSVQISLRLPSLDLVRARETAEKKGIGYQTLLKMLVHEGLERVENQRLREQAQ